MFLPYFSVHFLQLLKFFFRCFSLFCNRQKTSLLSWLCKCMGKFEDPIEVQYCYDTLSGSVYHIPSWIMSWVWSTGCIIGKGNLKYSNINRHSAVLSTTNLLKNFLGLNLGIHHKKPLYDHLSYGTSVTNIGQKVLRNSTFHSITHYKTTKVSIL